MTVGDARGGQEPLGQMEIEQIMSRIPHRYPFLLVDRILELEPGRRIVGLKNVSSNEPFFQGHFPDYPVMPGVLVVEAMAQVGGVLASYLPGASGHIAYFAAIDRLRFRRPVKPGDQLISEITVIKVRDRVGKMQVVARVDGAVVADGVFTYSLVSLRDANRVLADGKIINRRETLDDGG
jgi:3-hydroxyacyl-[acyl-carrier-protein] dehydratase